MRIYFCLFCIFVSCRDIYAVQFASSILPVNPYQCIVKDENYDEAMFHVKEIARQSVHNPTNIASLIAIAVVLKYNQQLNIQMLNDELVARYGDIDKSMNLLGVKTSLKQLGYSSHGVKSEIPLELLVNKSLLAFSVDDQRIYHLVYIHNSKAYIIYGLKHICPITLDYYTKWYASRKLLVLD